MKPINKRSNVEKKRPYIANNGKGNHKGRDGWITPEWLFKLLDNQYKFGLDCCASEKDRKCKMFENNFEGLRFTNTVAWMNPPFSIAWRMFEHFFKVIDQGVAIYRCDNFETALWQKIIFPHASWIMIPNRRISFEGLDGDGARFPSALIGYHVSKPKLIEGTVLYVR